LISLLHEIVFFALSDVKSSRSLRGERKAMGSVNLARDSTNQQTDEKITSVFRDVGQVLAEARIEQNLTIEDVASKIHIRQQYLSDLEEGDLAGLPGRVYILGFIRTYARLLNLDGEELVRRVNTLPNLPDYERSQVPFTSPSEEEPNSLFLIISGVLILLIAIGGYLFLRPSSKAPPALETALIDSVGQPEEKDTLTVPLLEEEVEPAQVLPLPKPTSPIELPEVGSAHPPLPVPSLSVNKLPSSTSKKITLKAREPSWVEIRDEAGRIYFMKVLKKGEEYVLPEKPGSIINTGNAGGIDIFVGDQKLPPLGARGDVKRGIRLETLQ
jgi:cytoskeleton protein RodZ